MFCLRCVPATCAYVTNAACVPTTTATDASIAQQISGTPCNSLCTPSKAPICSAASIARIFSKGINGVKSIKVVYCTDMYLVIQSNGMPNHNDSLKYVPRPPGGGGTSSYGTQCVTRSHTIQAFTFKIPLYPTALSTSSGAINNVAFITNKIPLSNVALPNEGAVGVTVTGLPIFPPYNNVGAVIIKFSDFF